MSRASLGALPSTPVAFLQAEGGSVAAVTRLDRRQEAFAIRLASGASPGPQASLLRGGSRLGGVLRERVGQGTVDGRIETIRMSVGMHFPGVIEFPPADGGKGKEKEKEERVEKAMEIGNRMEGDLDTIWTDGSKLEKGGVGAGVAWYEEVTSSGQQEKVVFNRRGFGTAGRRREHTRVTHQDRHRSMERARTGWRRAGFGMGRCHEA